MGVRLNGEALQAQVHERVPKAETAALVHNAGKPIAEIGRDMGLAEKAP